MAKLKEMPMVSTKIKSEKQLLVPECSDESEQLIISEDLFHEDDSGLRLRAKKGEVSIHHND